MAKKLTFTCHGKKLEIILIKDKSSFGHGAEKITSIAPGLGEFEINAPIMSSDLTANGIPINCKVKVTGRNIAQISLELMLKNRKTLIGPISQEKIHSPTDREVKGVRHPRWGSENEIEFAIPSTAKLLYCGKGFTLACMRPEKYDVSIDDQIWSLEGIYQRGGGEPFRAKLEFSNNGSLIGKTGFYPVSMQGLVSPFELFIEEGDTFEPYVSLLSENGEESLGTVNPIMFDGKELPHWKEVEISYGTYFVGVLVEDFDGQTERKHASFTIKKP